MKREPSQLFRIIPIIFGIVLCAFLFFGPLRSLILDPIREIIYPHLKTLAISMVFIFLICSTFLVIIVVLLERESRNLDRTYSKYKSAFVAEDYFKNVKRIDFYKAVRTCLTKYALRDDPNEEEKAKEQKAQINSPTVLKRKRDDGGAVKRYYDQESKDVDSAQLEETIRDDEDRSDGSHQVYYSDGGIAKEVTYKNGQLDGEFRLFYKDGQVNQEKFYRKGKLDGIFRAWDESGVLFFEMNFKDGVKNGIEKSFFKSGVIQFKDLYKDGELISRKTYDDGGTLIFSHVYVDEDGERVPASIENDIKKES